MDSILSSLRDSGTLAYGQQLPPPPAAPPSSIMYVPQPQTGSGKTVALVAVVVVVLLGLAALAFWMMSRKKNRDASESDDEDDRRKPRRHHKHNSGKVLRPQGSLIVPSSWDSMPADLRAKAEESFHRIGAYYLQQGHDANTASMKAAQDVENHIRSQVAARLQSQAPAAPQKQVQFNDVVRVNPAEVEGMVSARPGPGRPGAPSGEEGSHMMRPKQRAALETQRAAEALMESRPNAPAEPSDVPQIPRRGHSEIGAHDSIGIRDGGDDGFTPL